MISLNCPLLLQDRALLDHAFYITIVPCILLIENKIKMMNAQIFIMARNVSFLFSSKNLIKEMEKDLKDKEIEKILILQRYLINKLNYERLGLLIVIFL